MEFKYSINSEEVVSLVNAFLKEERNTEVRNLVKENIERIVNQELDKRRHEIVDRIVKQIEWSIVDAMGGSPNSSRINKASDILSRIVNKELEKYNATL